MLLDARLREYRACSAASRAFRSKACAWRATRCLWTPRKRNESLRLFLGRLTLHWSGLSHGTNQMVRTPQQACRGSRARVRLKWVVEFMKILVTFAVQSEFAPWRRRRNFMRLPGEWPVFETMFGGAQVRAILTGMGQDHALSAAKWALAYKPDMCISTGLAG